MLTLAGWSYGAVHSLLIAIIKPHVCRTPGAARLLWCPACKVIVPAGRTDPAWVDLLRRPGGARRAEAPPGMVKWFDDCELVSDLFSLHIAEESARRRDAKAVAQAATPSPTTIPPGPGDPADYEWLPEEGGEGGGVAKEESGAGPQQKATAARPAAPEQPKPPTDPPARGVPAVGAAAGGGAGGLDIRPEAPGWIRLAGGWGLNRRR